MRSNTENKSRISKLNTLNILVVCSAFILTSCASSVKNGFGSVFAEDMSKDSRYSMRTHYILGPDDIVNVIVEQHPEWSGEFIVGPDNRVSIPDLGEIFAGGLLKEELVSNIKEKLVRYIQSPRVSVEIVKYASEVIYVLGEVNRPGKYATGGKLATLRDAIIMAGLPRRYAATKRVFVISSSRTSKPVQRVVNLHRILYRGELLNDVTLEPGDIVYVPKTVLGMVTDFLSALTSPFSSFSAARAAVVP